MKSRAIAIALSASAIVACQKPTHIEISPKQPTLKSTMDSVQLIGRIMANTHEFPREQPKWSSKDESIATVGDDGRATCKTGGRVQLVAAYGDLVATVPLECLFVEKLRVDLPTVELSFEAGDPVKPKLEAIGYDGRPLKDRAAFFRPQNDKICRVDASGQFWPVNPGATVVVAEIDAHKLDIACVVK